MKISVFYDHVREAAGQKGKPEKALLEELYQAGIRGLEIRLRDLLEDQTLFERISGAGFSVSGIYEFYDMEKKGETEKAEKHIDTAVKTGCRQILAVPGFLDQKEAGEFHRLADKKDQNGLEAFMKDSREIAGMCQGLSFMTARGQEKGIRVTVEDFDDAASPLSRTLGIRWFLEQVPGLGFTFDTGNFAFLKEDIWEAWKILSPFVLHVHCKDRRAGLEPAPAGGGEIPMKELLGKLRETGYKGWLAAEHFGARDQEAFMLESAEFLRKYR